MAPQTPLPPRQAKSVSYARLSIARAILHLEPPYAKMLAAVALEPRFNEPLFNEVLDITNNILRPGQSYSKIYGIEPR